MAACSPQNTPFSSSREASAADLKGEPGVLGILWGFLVRLRCLKWLMSQCATLLATHLHFSAFRNDCTNAHRVTNISGKFVYGEKKMCLHYGFNYFFFFYSFSLNCISVSLLLFFGYASCTIHSENILEITFFLRILPVIIFA